MSIEILETQSELNLLQCLVYGESRGQPLEGMAAVAWVVRNRVEHPKWWGKDWKSVILRHDKKDPPTFQFSCFNSSDANLKKIIKGIRLGKLMSDQTWKTCRLIAFGVMYGWLPDYSKGSNHYCHVDLNPYWIKDQTPKVTICDHKFYEL